MESLISYGIKNYDEVFTQKPTISKVSQISSVSYSKYDLSILRSAVTVTVGKGERLIIEGGHYSVMIDSKDELNLSFSPQGGNGIIFNAPNHVLKFFAQIPYHENMSASWCMWFQSHPSKWNSQNGSFPQ